MKMLDLEWSTTIHLVMILDVLGIRQGESLAPFLFSMYLNGIEEHCILNGFEGIDRDMFKSVWYYMLMILQLCQKQKKGRGIVVFFCGRWKLTVNATKTKIMILWMEHLGKQRGILLIVSWYKLLFKWQTA